MRILPQSKQPIYALGGITIERLPEVEENGFYGAAFHGSIWTSDVPAYEIYINAKRAAYDLAIKRLDN